jgi:TRAP-type uncharacterized transport system fused permease subunit
MAMPLVPAWVDEHRFLLISLFLVGFLLFHRFRWLGGRQILVLLALLIFVAVFGFVSMMFEPVELRDVLLFMEIYGVALYILLCEVLLDGGNHWLTKKRGEKWVKELDYLYLTLGIVGILGSVNRIDQIRGRFSRVDILAPLVLVTAVVIRLSKTRAEIGSWNKPHSS